jgi:hypothetical protein
MNIELKNKAAYDLALEYVRQNNAMKVSTELTLEDQVENFKKTYDRIFQCLNNLS